MARIGRQLLELLVNVLDHAPIDREQGRRPAVWQPAPHLVDDRRMSAGNVAGVVEDRVAQKHQVLAHDIRVSGDGKPLPCIDARESTQIGSIRPVSGSRADGGNVGIGPSSSTRSVPSTDPDSSSQGLAIELVSSADVIRFCSMTSSSCVPCRDTVPGRRFPLKDCHPMTWILTHLSPPRPRGHPDCEARSNPADPGRSPGEPAAIRWSGLTQA